MSHLIRSAVRFWSAVILALSAGIIAYAQYTTASLGGTVYDPSGATVTDAKVTARNVETGLQKDSTTGTNGTFSFTALPVGAYEVTIEKPGFAKYIQQGITLELNQAANVTIQLKVGDLSQAVTIAADAELVNTQSGTVEQVIDQKKILDLPLNGRQPQDLLFLSAGTVNTQAKLLPRELPRRRVPRRDGGNVNGAGPRGQFPDGWRRA